jgi:Fis family transcriptional regulator, factor for inversion stimulation protein
MSKEHIEEVMHQSLASYLGDLGDETPHDLYTLFMQAAERPLLEVVLLKAKGNQVRAAQWLGLNRNTLRKKLVEHGLI